MENAYLQKVRRFYAGDLSEGSEEAELSGAEFRHLKTVLRLKEGSEAVLFNGRGLEFIAIIESIGKGVAKARIISRKQTLDRSPVDIILFQALVKGDKPEFIAQKATELGVKEVVFFSATRSVTRLNAIEAEKRMARFRKVTIEAAKQCGMGFLPEISYSEFIPAISESGNGLKVFFYEGERENRLRDAIKTYKHGSVYVVIGPEGGFSVDEVSAAKKEGFIPVTLGKRVLKAETAAVAAIAILQYELGDVG
ncbi:MAG: 16S rRNA (uracil(1498)-N(3))-methyltransferase [Thermodesulfobacteriota bacterium]